MTEPTSLQSNDLSFFTCIRKPASFDELQKQSLGPEVGEISQFVSGLSTKAQLDEILQSIIEVFPDTDSHYAGVASIVCGMIVERGGTPTIPVDPVVKVLLRQLNHIKEYEDSNTNLTGEEKFERFPDACKAESGIRFSVPAAMTMLSRDIESRKKWQHHADLLRRVTELEDHLPWFMERMFSLLDDLDIFLVDPHNKRVFVTHLTGVHNRMYHYFALVQHSLQEYAGVGYLNAKPTNPRAVRYAQNSNLTHRDHAESEDISETALLDFTYPGGHFLPGFCAFDELPRFQNKAFMVIEEKGSGGCPVVSWSPSNAYPVLHEKLVSSVDILRELSGEELETWIAGVVVEK